MSIERSSSSRRLLSFRNILLGVLVLAFFFTAGGFAFAATQESHDPFCASCHTEPESTFFQRSIDTAAIDLASQHAGEGTRCIDCHSGDGVLGRMKAELLGARNALAWYTHTAVQPAPLTVAIENANCLKCHQDVTQRGYQPQKTIASVTGNGRGEREEREEEGGNNHWHVLMARWQAIAPDSATCISCHSGHLTDGTVETGFENARTTRAACGDCHRVFGGEERE